MTTSMKAHERFLRDPEEFTRYCKGILRRWHVKTYNDWEELIQSAYLEFLTHYDDIKGNEYTEEQIRRYIAYHIIKGFKYQMRVNRSPITIPFLNKSDRSSLLRLARMRTAACRRIQDSAIHGRDIGREGHRASVIEMKFVEEYELKQREERFSLRGPVFSKIVKILKDAPLRDRILFRKHILEGMTLRDAGKQFRISGERVRQIVERTTVEVCTRLDALGVAYDDLPATFKQRVRDLTPASPPRSSPSPQGGPRQDPSSKP